MTDRPQPKRGEEWWVKPGKTAGAELQKKRPNVVVSAGAIGNLPVKVVVPLRSWQDRFKGVVWLVPIAATSANGLKRDAAADVLQIKSFDTNRFEKMQGRLTADELDEITAALAIVVEYQ